MHSISVHELDSCQQPGLLQRMGAGQARHDSFHVPGLHQKQQDSALIYYRLLDRFLFYNIEMST
jgi:hypothetical protein